MATLDAYRAKFRWLTRQEITSYRRELFETINGDASFPLKAWPREYTKLFWAKPMGDMDVFKLTLFLSGNGCSPHVITSWILSSQNWSPSKGEKRARQMDFILNNMDQKSGTWFYFDIDYGKWLYLNGLPKQTAPH